MKQKQKRFQLTAEIHREIILSALNHIADGWITQEARRLHKHEGTPQTQAIKQCLGTAGQWPHRHRSEWSWDTCPKGLMVNRSKAIIIPWSDFIPYVWPVKPVKHKPIKGKVQPTSAWASL